jgi:hypothetical protein
MVSVFHDISLHWAWASAGYNQSPIRHSHVVPPRQYRKLQFGSLFYDSERFVVISSMPVFGSPSRALPVILWQGRLAALTYMVCLLAQVIHFLPSR